MKNNLRGMRVLCILIALLMVLQTGISLSGSTRLNAYGATDGDYSFEIIDGVASITGYSGSDTELMIPSTVTDGINQYSVSSIGDSAFDGYSSLTSITIPASVTNIGNYAFCGCEGLTSITIPTSVTNIGDSAFSNCKSLTGITIPTSVTNIGDDAFISCSKLTSMTIPTSVTSIGDYAFSYCGGLTSITIPNSVTSIGMNAFSNCGGLTSITIPNSVTSIDSYAFSMCNSLKSVYFLGDAPSLGNDVFTYCADLFRVYYLSDSMGFTNPWYGYPTATFKENNTVEPDFLVAITPLTVVPVGYVGIYTTQDLNAVRDNLSGNYILMNDLVFSDSDFMVGGLFYNNGAGFCQIGTLPSNPFKGIFDGNGHKITGLKQDISSVSNRTGGLFGFISSATIMNLGIIYSDIKVAVLGLREEHINIETYVGGIVGCANYSNILNCFNVCDISETTDINSTKAITVGGIVGEAYAGTIANCINYGSIRATSYASFATAGGVVGSCGNSNATIVNCANKGDIYSTSFSSVIDAGGVSGRGTANIRNCYNSGEVQGTSLATSTYSPVSAGGIAGSSGSISNSYNAGNVSALCNGTYNCANINVGGITGYSSGGLDCCYNIGEIRVASSLSKVGGITGISSGTISNCYYLDTISKGVGSGNAIANKLTEAQMRQQSSFVGFDFVNDWNCSISTTFPYPDIMSNVYLGMPYFIVSFDSQIGGTQSSTSATRFYNALVKPIDPTREGYTFCGWYKEPSCLNAWDFTNDKITAETTLYAKWTINKYLVTFNSQGGSYVGSVNKDFDTVISTPPEPSKTECTFGGWYKEPTCINEWDFSSDKIKADTTLYAKWVVNQYSVTFNSLGGSYFDTILADYDTTVNAPSTPIKTGYTFYGWYKDPDYRSAWDFAKDKVIANTTLYAYWNANTYTVNFDANGGSGTMISEGIGYDYSFELPSNGFTKPGYTFSGWAKTPTGAVAFSNGDTILNLSSQNYSEITLYAKWVPNTYTIKFNINGGTSGTMASQPMTYNTTKSLTANAFKKTGYSFLGWATTSTGIVAYKDLAAVKNLTATKGVTINLYGKWGVPILSAASYNYTSIRVSWAYAGSATSYKVYRSTSATGTYSLVYTAASTSRSWVDTGQTTGKYYYYKVYPVAGGRTYTNSTYKYAKPIPATPTTTLTKYTSTSIKVAWGGVSGASGYQVYRASSAAGTYSLIYTATSTARSWVNTGRTVGGTYYYKVRAYHIENDSRIYGSFSSAKNLKL